MTNKEEVLKKIDKIKQHIVETNDRYMIEMSMLEDLKQFINKNL